MTNAKKRLKETEATIKGLTEALRKAELEKAELLKEIYGTDHNVIDAMPARVRNVLKLLGINTDLLFKKFIEGKLKKSDIKPSGGAQFNFEFYKNKADSRETRLMSLRGVGKNMALESVCIAEAKGM